MALSRFDGSLDRAGRRGQENGLSSDNRGDTSRRSQDSAERRRDLRPPGAGDRMSEDGIRDGDVVVVKRQATAENGQTVVAVVNGEDTIKPFY